MKSVYCDQHYRVKKEILFNKEDFLVSEGLFVQFDSVSFIYSK